MHQEREDYSDDDLYPSQHRLTGKMLSIVVGFIIVAVVCGCPLLPLLLKLTD